MDTVRIVFIGDSLTAGYGLSIDEAFPSLVSRKAKEESLSIEVINAGVSGDTTAGGLKRLRWILKSPADIYVIALGGNDGLRGLDLQQTKANVKNMISDIRSHSPGADVVLMQMEIPPHFGPDYTRSFRDLFPELAESEQVPLGPFLLKGVATLLQKDRMHPNLEGQARIADTVWDFLRPLVERKLGKL